MAVDHPDFVKTILPGRSTTILGQSQYIEVATADITALASANLMSYLVPTGKRLDIWFVDVSITADVLFEMSLIATPTGQTNKRECFGNGIFAFPDGAALQVTAGNHFNLSVFNYNSTTIPTTASVFGTLVDV